MHSYNENLYKTRRINVTYTLISERYCAQWTDLGQADVKLSSDLPTRLINITDWQKARALIHKATQEIPKTKIFLILFVILKSTPWRADRMHGVLTDEERILNF